MAVVQLLLFKMKIRIQHMILSLAVLFIWIIGWIEVINTLKFHMMC